VRVSKWSTKSVCNPFLCWGLHLEVEGSFFQPIHRGRALYGPALTVHGSNVEESGSPLEMNAVHAFFGRVSKKVHGKLISRYVFLFFFTELLLLESIVPRKPHSKLIRIFLNINERKRVGSFFDYHRVLAYGKTGFNGSSDTVVAER